MQHVTRVHQGKPVDFDTAVRDLTELSAADAGLVIQMGGAYLGKYRCKEPQQKVRAGDVVSAYYRFPIEMRPVPFHPEWVLKDDGNLLIAEKPAGMPTQGRRDADYMAFYELLKKHVGGYVGLHHRLDQDTSGLMVFTRRQSLNKDLSDLFQNRRIEKHYLAVSQGVWPFGDNWAEIDAPILPRKLPNGVKQVIDGRGKTARTRVRLLARDGDKLLIEACPLTGRTHQIRVHLSHVGLPLLGDTFYGGRTFERFLLHCHKLVWPKFRGIAAGHYVSQPPEDWGRLVPNGLILAPVDGEVT